jgi:TP901 family phage tail tape measure protein
MAYVGTMYVGIRFDTAQMGADLRRSLSGIAAGAGDSAGAAVSASMSQRLTTLGTSLGNVGRQVSLGLSLPLIAFGKAATSAFTQFDTAMTQVVTLSGVAASTVRDWNDDVMALGGTYGVAAGEAADALYFITSSGVDAADAIEVLDIAAKSSALGLGTAKVAADVMTSAMNQYGKENISAAQAADILTVAVREGKGEADEMAGALARVIPLAGSMGVKFGEVSGVMSAMTLSGTSADEAATQINALLTTLQKMPKHAQEDMKALTGLDYATVQQDLSTKGLTLTLRDIYNAFEDNEDAIGRVFGNTRALRGITNLFGEKEAQTLAVVRKTTNALGAQDEAMEKLNASPAFRLEQAQANFSNAMTNIGSAVTPVMATVTDVFADVLGAFKALGPVGETVGVGLATIAAASGPLLYMSSSVLRLAGNIGTLWSTMALGARFGTAMLNLSDSTSALARGFARAGLAANHYAATIGKVALGVGAAVVAVTLLNSKLHENDEAIKALEGEGKTNLGTKNFDQLGDTIGRVNEQIESINREKDELASNPFEMALNAKALNELDLAQKSLVGIGNAALKIQTQADAVAKKYGVTRDAAAAWIQTEKGAGEAFDDATAAIKAFADGQRDGTEATKKATNASNEQKKTLSSIIAAVKDTSDAFFGVINAQKSYADAQKAITDAKGKVADAEKAHTDAIKGTADAQRKVVEADRKVIESGEKLAESRQAAAEAQKRLNDLLAGPSKSEQLDLRSARLALREAQEATKGKKLTPIERERAQIALERARLDLAEAQKAHEEAITDARKDLRSATDDVADAEQSRQDAITAAADARTAVQVARDKEHETLVAIGGAQDAVTQAQIDALKPAMDLTGAIETQNTKFATGTIEREKFKDYLTRLKDLYPELTGELDKYIKKFEELERQNPKPPPPTAAEKLGGSITSIEQSRAAPPPTDEELRRYLGNAFGRATGGPVAAMTPYEVNERNMPELLLSGGRQFLLPVDAGHVVPLQPSAQGAEGGPSLNVGEINVYGADQPTQTAYEIRRQLRAKRDLVGRR